VTVPLLVRKLKESFAVLPQQWNRYFDDSVRPVLMVSVARSFNLSLLSDGGHSAYKTILIDPPWPYTRSFRYRQSVDRLPRSRAWPKPSLTRATTPSGVVPRVGRLKLHGRTGDESDLKPRGNIDDAEVSEPVAPYKKNGPIIRSVDRPLIRNNSIDRVTIAVIRVRGCLTNQHQLVVVPVST